MAEELNADQILEIENNKKAQEKLDADKLAAEQFVGKNPIPPKEEDKSEKKVEKPESKKGDAPEGGEDDFEVDYEQILKDKQTTGKKKIEASRFKEIDDDFGVDEDLELDEATANILEKVLARTSDYKKKGNEYKVIAESQDVIEKDDKIKAWSSLYQLDDEKLATTVWENKYIRAGKTAEDAKSLAEAKIADMKEKTPAMIATIAEESRLDLQAAANDRISEIRKNISDTKKALSLSTTTDPELVKKTVEALSKIENFAGLKVGSKNPATKKDIMKPVEAKIKDGSFLKKLQENPELLAEVAYYDEYKEQITAAVKRRGTDRKKGGENLNKAPHSNGTESVRQEKKNSGAGGMMSEEEARKF